MLKQAFINEFKMSLPRFILYTIIWLIIFLLLGFEPSFFESTRSITLNRIIENETVDKIVQYPIDEFFYKFINKQRFMLIFIQIFLISIIFGSEIPLDSEKGFLSLIKTTGVKMESYVSLKIITTSIVVIIAELIGWIIFLFLEGFLVFYDYPDLMIKFLMLCSLNFVTFFVYQALMILIFISITYYFSYFCNDYKIASIILPIVFIVENGIFSEISKIFPIEKAAENTLSYQGLYGILESVMTWENNFYILDFSIVILVLAYLIVHQIVFTALFFNLAKRKQFY